MFPGGETRSAVFYGSGGVSNVVLSLMQVLDSVILIVYILKEIIIQFMSLNRVIT